MPLSPLFVYRQLCAVEVIYGNSQRLIDTKTAVFHQAADNPDNIDHSYLLKYAQSYTYAARLIANRAQAPAWIAGDKYEAAYKKLYGK